MEAMLQDRAIYAEIVNFNEMFTREAAADQPVLITEFDVTRVEDKERLNRILMTRYSDDTLDVVPRCDCGKLQGEFNVGVKCAHCLTICDHVTERPLKPSMWLEVPKGVRAFINPHVWSILHKALGTGTSNVLEYLTNPYYRPANITPAIKKVIDMEIPRGLNYFVDNFDTVIQQLFERRGIVAPTKKQATWAFIQRYRDCIFCRYLPVPSKLTFITELNAGVTYTDKTMTLALDAVRTINSITTAVMPLNEKQCESRTIIAVALLSEYYWTFMGDATGAKVAVIRQHIVGCRPHFTGRAVISSRADAHRFDELLLPWGVGVMLFKVHLTNLLMRRGMTPNEIHRLLFEHTNRYHPLLAELFDELLYTGDGMWVTLTRNPSLVRLATQFFRVGGIRHDANINTIGFSVGSLAGPNSIQSYLH